MPSSKTNSPTALDALTDVTPVEATVAAPVPVDAQPLLNWLRRAEFMTSAPKLSLCPPDTGFEIAFAGRSNAGKSSAINAMTAQKQLARAS